jgi:hypothetical protein
MLASVMTAAAPSVPADPKPNQAPRVDVFASSPSTLLIGSS